MKKPFLLCLVFLLILIDKIHQNYSVLSPFNKRNENPCNQHFADLIMHTRKCLEHSNKTLTTQLNNSLNVLDVKGALDHVKEYYKNCHPRTQIFNTTCCEMSSSVSIDCDKIERLKIPLDKFFEDIKNHLPKNIHDSFIKQWDLLLEQPK